MRQIAKKTLLRIFPLGILLIKLIRLLKSNDSYLQATGWNESWRRGYPCRSDGTELPWMNYPVIHFLEQRLNSDLSLFEFGSGYSTLFYARLTKDVTSVEYDQFWLETIKKKLPDNASLLFQPKDTNGLYCRTVTNTGKLFDVIIIDGRDRVNCIQQSINHLKPNGVMILDDSQREKYAPGLLLAKELGFKLLDFEGLKPTGYDLNRTTIMYRPSNCLEL